MAEFDAVMGWNTPPATAAAQSPPLQAPSNTNLTPAESRPSKPPPPHLKASMKSQSNKLAKQSQPPAANHTPVVGATPLADKQPPQIDAVADAAARVNALGIMNRFRAFRAPKPIVPVSNISQVQGYNRFRMPTKRLEGSEPVNLRIELKSPKSKFDGMKLDKPACESTTPRHDLIHDANEAKRIERIEQRLKESVSDEVKKAFESAEKIFESKLANLKKESQEENENLKKEIENLKTRLSWAEVLNFHLEKERESTGNCRTMIEMVETTMDCRWQVYREE